jgi:hypothetical protein
MNVSVYKFNFELPNSTLEDIISQYDIDKSVYDLMEGCLFLENDINGKLEQIMLINKDQFELITKLLHFFEIRFIYTDITVDVLQSIITFDDEFFQQQINQWVSDNLTLDIILDKINLYGIDSLTEFEKNKLKSF